MERSFREILLGNGAVMDGATATPLHFGDARAEVDAALHRCVLVDRTPFSRVLSTGPDLLDLLQRLTTADVADLAPGTGRPTVVTSPKGRIVERLFVHHLGATGVLLCGRPGKPERLLEHLARYTFAEDTGLEDWAPRTCQFALSGPMGREALCAAGFDSSGPQGSRSIAFEGQTVHVLGQDCLDGTGLSLVVPRSHAGSLWQSLVLAVRKVDGTPAGAEAIEAYRILRGIPLGGTELTEEYNPLEAGLVDAVSFDKGCYVGQEVVARLQNYDKVARRLMGIVLPERASVPAAGTPLFDGSRETGRVTSALLPPGRSRPLGLAYVKHRRVETGTELCVGAAESPILARLVELPFSTSTSRPAV